MKLTDLTLSEVAAGLAAGDFTSVEITKAYLDRISQYGDEINCYITHTAERALADAAASDERRKNGTTLSPLDGAPIGMKD
jgi:aspartyl-tRNA(Asn)/glutamyl-tRNA(Gln) amidotransferase subunit A